jgi:hypothetical protein
MVDKNIILSQFENILFTHPVDDGTDMDLARCDLHEI